MPSRARKAAGQASFQQSEGKNYIYNGDTSLCQRATNVTGIGNGDSGYHVQDRYKVGEGGAPNAEVTMTRSTTVPDGFQYSMLFDCTTASGTVSAADAIYFSQLFEGQDLYAWNKGDAQARPVTLSFWVNATKTGTYVCSMYDADNGRQNSQSYTVSSSNTWEHKSVTFPGDTTGVFDRDNNVSLYIHWALVAGTDWTSGTLQEAWASSTTANIFVGQVDALDNTSNNYHITGIQLELGAVATDFQNETYGKNFLRCARYYEKRLVGIIYGSNNAGGAGYYDYAQWQFKVRKRATPTATGHTGTQQQNNVDGATCYNNGTYPSWSATSTADSEL